MAQHHDDINRKFSENHIIEDDPERFAMNYDPMESFNSGDQRGWIGKMLTSEFISTSGSAIVSGKYAGHSVCLDQQYDWVIREYETWTGYVTKMLVPLKKIKNKNQ